MGLPDLKIYNTGMEIASKNYKFEQLTRAKPEKLSEGLSECREAATNGERAEMKWPGFCERAL